jgi:hypothetical protein
MIEMLIIINTYTILRQTKWSVNDDIGSKSDRLTELCIPTVNERPFTAYLTCNECRLIQLYINIIRTVILYKFHTIKYNDPEIM